jgi:hypothetical protein
MQKGMCFSYSLAYISRSSEKGQNQHGIQIYRALIVPMCMMGVLSLYIGYIGSPYFPLPKPEEVETRWTDYRGYQKRGI